MAATETLKSSTLAARIVYKTDPDTGKVTLRNVAIPDVQADPDPDAVIELKTGLAPCLAYPINAIQHTKTTLITEE